ncbi:unnamed protein product [Didymodactylos carnosus]|uniref:G-protein coupled receptors family 1 profile domain-containing protein n=1 Tax=Didymodactylos carnosus TaxID=1234261 RepID=A0A814QU97_9BILA|nr:unnamed protein product [Didymodactylos carnosus]CAF1365107.1 unnamed protein product [Didymodactylos carnosus]CAF3887219.1 unnamed protein product [Didymodactylos carnosus]CAF4174593.1 unnamed protein product [Didymodactylos carnosus]
MPSRILSEGFNIDPGTYSDIYCKLRYYIPYTARTLSSTFIALASIDRFASSSQQPKIRKFSQLKIAYIVIIIATMFCLLIFVHVLLYFNIELSLDEYNRLLPSCYAQKGFYRIFADFFYLTCYTLIPPFIMIIFSILIVRNVFNLRRQLDPATTTAMCHLHRKDRQLIIMLIFQVVSIVITTLPHAIQKLYSTYTANMLKSSLTLAQENFLLQLVRSISFINHSCSFYIFTLSGQTFRNEFYRIINKCGAFKIKLPLQRPSSNY